MSALAVPVLLPPGDCWKKHTHAVEAGVKIPGN